VYVYGNNADFPEDAIEILSYSNKKQPVENGFEKVSYVRIAYRPFQYNPISQELTLIDGANIHLDYDRLSSPPMTGYLGPGYDYIIITTNAIVENSTKLDNFIYLKELMGHDVLVVTEDDFDGLTGQPPNGRAEKIRQWLIDNDPVHNIDYVLLIGDPDPDDENKPGDTIGDIPMKMLWPGYHNPDHRQAPSDYFYADLSSDWNLDGDGYFGELLPEDHDTSPDPSMGSDYFSVEWNGKVMIDFNERYKFRLWSDDGAELYLDGDKIIDDWAEHPPKSNWSVPQLLATGKHNITLKFRENTGDGIIRLYWKTQDSGNVSGMVPDTHLYDTSDVVGGLDGTYYDNADFSGPTITRKDPKIDFYWLTGDKGPLGMDSEADVYVGRIPVYDQDYAQLDNILEKTIKYETDPGDISWRESILLPMKPLWHHTPSFSLGEGIKDDIAVPAGFSYYRIYDEDYGVAPEKTPCNYSNVLDEWKEGYGMVVWATHGGQEHGDAVFHRDDTPELNDSKPALTFQASCNTGWPENHNNLGYSLLKEGAVATVAASRVTWEYYYNWTFHSDDEANHNLAYFYTDKVISDGMTTGASLYETKGDIPEVGSNMMKYNLYGDPGLYFLVTEPNLPPVADANGPYVEAEGTPVDFDGSGSYDPEGDPLEYRWDLDNNGVWDTGWSPLPTTSWTWGDDYNGEVMLQVRDLLGFTGEGVTTVNITNVAPTIENIEAYIQVNFTLRVAGEKWHNVELYVYANGTEIGYAEVVRYPGSPDDQAVTITVICDLTKVITVKVLYTPLDDPVNGQPNGASPAWVNISFEDGGYNVSHHTFNVQHPDTWEWNFGVNQFFVGHEITFEADATDPGSDDLTFKWEWNDGTADNETLYYNNGHSPDPYPSPWGPFPASQTDEIGHVFAAAGTYNVDLTVTDDDGDLDTTVIIIILI